MPILALLSYASLLTLALLDNARGPFYPEILTDFGVNASSGSLFFACTSVMAFLASWFAPRFLKHYSSITLLFAGSLLLGAGFVGIALLHDFRVVLIACAVFGIAYGGLNLAQAVLITEAADGERRRRLFSGQQAMYGLASLTAPLLAGICRDAGLTWRSTFLILAAVPVVLGIYSLRYRHLGHVHAEETRPQPLSKREWRDCFLYALILAAYLWGDISVSTRIVLWLRTERGFTPDHADAYLSGFFAMLLMGRVFFGGIGFKRISNWTVMAASSTLGATLYFVGLSYLPALVPLSGLAMSPFYPVCMDQISRHFGKKSSQALGFTIGFGSASCVLMHIVIGLIDDSGGLTLALKVCAGVLGVLGAALVVHAARVDGVRAVS